MACPVKHLYKHDDLGPRPPTKQKLNSIVKCFLHFNYRTGNGNSDRWILRAPWPASLANW